MRCAGGREQKHPTVGVLVDEDIVKAARVVGDANAADLAHRRGVWQVGYVEDDRTQIGVRPALTELKRLHHVVAVVPLEQLDVETAAHVQVRVGNPPAVEHRGVRRIAHVDDVHAALVALEGIAADVGVGTVEVLFDLDIGDRVAAERHVSDDLDVVASAPVGCPLGSETQRSQYHADHDAGSKERRWRSSHQILLLGL